MKAWIRNIFYRRMPGLLILLFLTGSEVHGQIWTVNGPIKPGKAGWSLSHEHLLVDFIGAKLYQRTRWNQEEVVQTMLPYLKEIKSLGIRTFYDCTPQFLGRDPALLLQLAELSGVNIVTNTGYYGGSDHKYLPDQVFTAPAPQLAEQWIHEFEQGLNGTAVKPGFIKISVNPGSLSEESAKLITAAAITHLATGLTIASHTGPSLPAEQQIDILRQMGVSPQAFIWVHAQNADDLQVYQRLAAAGAWISLDGVHPDQLNWYVDRLVKLKAAGVLKKILLSHDAGWYDPAQPGGGPIRGFTTIHTQLIPALKKQGFTTTDLQLLLIKNPARAYTVRVRKLKRH